MNPFGEILKLTSVCDHPQVRSDDLHVDPLLLVANDHRSPQTTGRVSLLFAFTWETLSSGHRSVIWKQGYTKKLLTFRNIRWSEHEAQLGKGNEPF